MTLAPKVAAFAGAVAGSITALIEFALLAQSSPSGLPPLTLPGVVAAVGFGGMGGFGATMLVVGSYKQKVETHDLEIKRIEQSKADLKVVEMMQQQLGEVHASTQMLVQHMLNNPGR
jgi:hypothetical protein